MVEEKRFAVLVDAENVSSKYIKYIMDELSDYGVVTYKRIYTDWTQPLSAGWKKVLSDYAFSPMQQYSYSAGKNSTDSAMIIDAMDILYSNMVEGFCIVSSDSDFTKLAIRLKESGMMVVGMGEQKTPKAFSAACNVFKYLDILAEDDLDEDVKMAVTDSQKRSKAQRMAKPGQKPPVEKTLTGYETIKNTILKILSDRDGGEKPLSIGELGNLLVKRYPDFDVRNYGYSKLSKFLETLSFVYLQTQGNIIYASLQKHQDEGNLEREIVDIIKESGNQIDMGKLSQRITDLHPDFNVRDHGYTKFQNLIQNISGIVIRRKGKNQCNKVVELEKDQLN